MTVAQKRRRARLEAADGRPDPRGIEHGMTSALRLAAPGPQALVVRSDEHDDYPRALSRLSGYVIAHERTSSQEARTANNPLFPVNRADLLLRPHSANHKRETIAFSKLNLAVAYRCAWLALWQNFSKPFSERRNGGTPAMRLGLSERPIPVAELLGSRLFPIDRENNNFRRTNEAVKGAAPHGVATEPPGIPARSGPVNCLDKPRTSEGF